MCSFGRCEVRDPCGLTNLSLISFQFLGLAAVAFVRVGIDTKIPQVLFPVVCTAALRLMLIVFPVSGVILLLEKDN